MDPPPRLRLRQRQPPRLKVDVLPLDAQHFANPQPGQCSHSDRGHGHGVLFLVLVQRLGERGQFGRRLAPGRVVPRVARSMPRQGLVILRSPFPLLETD